MVVLKSFVSLFVYIERSDVKTFYLLLYSIALRTLLLSPINTSPREITFGNN
mgnify:CR=1 FL=1